MRPHIRQPPVRKASRLSSRRTAGRTPWPKSLGFIELLRAGHRSGDGPRSATSEVGFGISESTAHAYTSAIIHLLAERAPGLLKVLREADADFVLLDGTLAECDRVGDGRADYSHKHRRRGANVQVVTDPGGRLLWLSPALPGRVHDLTAARTHRIIRICERQGVPVLADLAYQGGGPWVTTGIKHRRLQELTLTEKTVNRTLSAARAPVERGVARLKS